jgi:hypothetical protein
MSITDWQRQQYFSHWQLSSGCSHWAQRYLAGLAPVLMELMLARAGKRSKMTLVIVDCVESAALASPSGHVNLSVTYNFQQ